MEEVIKTCSKCLKDLEISKFKHLTRNGWQGYTTICKSCINELSEINRNSPNKPANNLPNYIQHGISKKAYDNLMEIQDYRCVICQNHFSLGIRSVLDHDHKCCPGDRSCGKCIRGILCVSCNVALGMLKDDVERARNVFRYLKENAHLEFNLSY